MKAKVNLNPFVYLNIEEGTRSYFAHIDNWPGLSLAEKNFYKKAHINFKRIEREAYHLKNMQVRKMTDTIKAANARRWNEDDHETAQSYVREFKSLDSAGDIELNRILANHRERNT